MCLNDYDLKCVPQSSLNKRQRNSCNEKLAVNRDVVCSVLASCIQSFTKPVKCFEGIGVCGIYSMIWKKLFNESVDVTINGFQQVDYDLICENLKLNGLSGKITNEDPCILLRKENFDFIFLNCKTNASQYFDSVFSSIKDEAVLVITTSEDPSLYWQAPEVALRNYGGVISKTSYHREVAVRLVIAEMARVCARYNKGLKILCSVGYKPQQSFTIVAKVKKGIVEANQCYQNIKKLAHCNICENRKFISNSDFLDKLGSYLNCDCSKESEGKVIIGIGPLWAGEIFDAEFISQMIQHSKGFPWEERIYPLLDLILQEARCNGKSDLNSVAKKPKLNEEMTASTETPYFYINTHRHSPKELRLQKLSRIVSLLQDHGYRASRTHFDSEAIRTNASLKECIKVLRQNSHGVASIT